MQNKLLTTGDCGIGLKSQSSVCNVSLLASAGYGYPSRF